LARKRNMNSSSLFAPAVSNKFTVSGGNNRGTYGLPPCFNYPTPL
jgi:hypothetical protein